MTVSPVPARLRIVYPVAPAPAIDDPRPGAVFNEMKPSMTICPPKPVRLLLAAAGIALVAGACTPMVDLRGNRAEADDLRQIHIGLTTKQEVARRLGSPSNVSPFDKKTWYYISKREEHFAFFKPNVTQQKVVAIRFDDEGVVQGIKRYGLGDARNVELVSRVTKSRGGEPGMLRSLWDTFTRSRLGQKSKGNHKGPFHP